MCRPCGGGLSASTAAAAMADTRNLAPPGGGLARQVLGLSDMRDGNALASAAAGLRFWPGSGWVVRHVRDSQADSAFDSSMRWTGSHRGGQQKTVAHGFEYGHGPPKTLTDDCPADGIQKVRGSNPLGSTTKCCGLRCSGIRHLVVARSEPEGLTAVLTA